jgi:hypothetical protein
MLNPILLLEQGLQDVGLTNVVQALDEVGKFNFNHLINDIETKFRKDEASVAMAGPAIAKKAHELGVLLGAALASGDAAKILEASTNGENFAKEAEAVARAEAAQLGHPLSGDPGEAYPFANEKEAFRILIKRWSLDPKWATLIGVSDGTATDYLDAFKAKYLS